MVARGRAEGPTSPYFVEELALQNTACCESHPAGSYKALGCLGPKCSDLGLAPNTLLTAELDEMSEYFHLFDRVYIGTTTWQEWQRGNSTSTSEYAQRQAKIGRQFMERYGHLEHDGRVKFAWYLTDEGSLPYIGINPRANQYMAEYLALSMQSLYAVKEMDFLWSPSNGDFSPNVTQRQSELTGLKHMLCGLPHPLGIHFQDYLGQSVSFQFPFFYNYSQAFTCERDTLATYNMLKQIQQSCPDKLREVKVNAELFAERLATGTHSRGEDNGANIINADPREVGLVGVDYFAFIFCTDCDKRACIFARVHNRICNIRRCVLNKIYTLITIYNNI